MREYKQRERSVYGCSRSPCLYGVGFEDSAGHVDLTPARLSERVSDGDGVIMLCRPARSSPCEPCPKEVTLNTAGKSEATAAASE